MLKSFKHHIKRHARKSTNLFLMRELPYIEFHLTDHCNLNCKGCTHYCPVAPEQYADLQQHKKDMLRLSQLFKNICVIRLMGGEPLLHPDAHLFIKTTRLAFPNSDLRFVTNGILLPKASDVFWEACRNTHAIIDLTIYPPLLKHLKNYYSLCNTNGVRLSITFKENFLMYYNSRGNSNKKQAFKNCRKMYFCPYLQNGRLYSCAKAALVKHLNKAFDTTVTANEGIDIHTPSISGRRIIKQLNTSAEACKWCSTNYAVFPWAESNRKPEEWDIESYKTTT